MKLITMLQLKFTDVYLPPSDKIIIDHNCSKFEKIGHPSSLTQRSYPKHCDDSSDVMLSHSNNEDNFSTAKAGSFVNVTKKRKAKEKFDHTKGRNLLHTRKLY